MKALALGLCSVLMLSTFFGCSKGSEKPAETTIAEVQATDDASKSQEVVDKTAEAEAPTEAPTEATTEEPTQTASEETPAADAAAGENDVISGIEFTAPTGYTENEASGIKTFMTSDFTKTIIMMPIPSDAKAVGDFLTSLKTDDFSKYLEQTEQQSSAAGTIENSKAEKVTVLGKDALKMSFDIKSSTEGVPPMFSASYMIPTKEGFFLVTATGPVDGKDALMKDTDDMIANAKEK